MKCVFIDCGDAQNNYTMAELSVRWALDKWPFLRYPLFRGLVYVLVGFASFSGGLWWQWLALLAIVVMGLMFMKASVFGVEEFLTAPVQVPDALPGGGGGGGGGGPESHDYEPSGPDVLSVSTVTPL